MPKAAGEITRLLRLLEQGENPEVSNELASLVYADLRLRARGLLRHEGAAQSVQSAGLVNEAFMRLIGGARISSTNRAQFFGAAVIAMKRVLIEHARRRNAQRRGGGRQVVPLENALDVAVENSPDIERLYGALDRLAELDPRQAKVVELKFFAGLTIKEIAGVLGMSASRVRADWEVAQAWLRRELEP